MIVVARYRPAVKIIMILLECVEKNEIKGRALKTRVIQCANMKATSAERYLGMLRDAGYIYERKEPWGERSVTVYELTPLGRDRFEWFKKINEELFKNVEWGEL